MELQELNAHHHQRQNKEEEAKKPVCILVLARIRGPMLHMEARQVTAL